MENKNPRVTIDISWSSFLRVIVLGVAIWLLLYLREIFLLLFAVFIFVAGVNPAIMYFQKYMSRTLAVTLFFTLFLLAVGLISYSFIPALVGQVNDLVRETPRIIQTTKPYFQSFQAYSSGSLFDQTVSTITSNLKTVSSSLYDTTINIFGGLASLVIGLVISFYLLLEEKNAKEFFHQLLPHDRYEAVYETVRKISDRMGQWIRGQLSLMLIIGASDLLAFLIIGVATPLPLAIWAGLCEVIPYLGPILGVIPATIVALSTGSPLQALIVFLVGFFVIQQIEGHIVVPKVMGKAVGLSPVLVIIALLTGEKLFGIVGAFLAIPAAAVISVLVGEWPNLRKLMHS